LLKGNCDPDRQRRREARCLAESGGRGREVMSWQRRLERDALGGEPRRRLGAEMPGLAAAARLPDSREAPESRADVRSGVSRRAAVAVAR